MRSLSVRWQESAAAVASLMLLVPAAAGAQSRSFTACTPDVLGVCTDVRLTAGPGAFEIALRTLAASGSPGTPVSVYNLVFGTGAPAAALPGSFAPVPGMVGGATLSDASPWDLFDAGDVLFLSALSNRGIGGCVAGADVGGFGQAAFTCGPGQFVTFSFTSTAMFDPAAITLVNLEAVGLTAGLPGASCGSEGAPCVITEGRPNTPPSTTVPEPGTLALIGLGVAGMAAWTRRRTA